MSEYGSDRTGTSHSSTEEHHKTKSSNYETRRDTRYEMKSMNDMTHPSTPSPPAWRPQPATPPCIGILHSRSHCKKIMVPSTTACRPFTCHEVARSKIIKDQ